MPENTTLKKQLQFAAEGKKRSASARLKDVLDDVENAIYSGVKHEEIIALLKNDGLHFTLKSFRNALFYLRKNKIENKGKNPLEKKPVIAKKAPITKPDLSNKTQQKSTKDDKQSLDLKALSKLGASTKRNVK